MVFSRVIVEQMLDHVAMKDESLRALCVANRSLASTPVSKSFASYYLYNDFHADRLSMVFKPSVLRFTIAFNKSFQAFSTFVEDA